MSSRLVYSTKGNNHCSQCGKVLHKCKCSASAVEKNSDGVIRISRETKGRKGAGVTLIDGLNLAPEELKPIARQLKTRCGVGGTVKKTTIEIQGNQRETVKAFFESQGYTVKLVGG